MATIFTEIEGPVAVVTFAAPPGSWMDVASLFELMTTLEELASRTEEISVVVLTGGVDGHFVAHADFDDLARWRDGTASPDELEAWDRATRAIAALLQPTVAAIDGQAWGGGCELALACTMRVGSERAHIALPEVSVGLIPGAGGTQRLPRLVPPAVAAEIILSAKILDAERALSIGLLNAVLPVDGFVPAVVKWCGRFTRHPHAALHAAKRAVVDGLQLSLDDGLALEKVLFDELNSSDDARERNRQYARPL